MIEVASCRSFISAAKTLPSPADPFIAKDNPFLLANAFKQPLRAAICDGVKVWLCCSISIMSDGRELIIGAQLETAKAAKNSARKRPILLTTNSVVRDVCRLLIV